MANGDVIKLGGLYLNNVLQTRAIYPWSPVIINTENGNIKGDTPAFTPGATIEIRNTPTDDTKKIQWVEVSNGGKRYLIADRALLSFISWDDLNAQNLVTGKEIVIDNKRYLIRLMTVGTESEGSDYNLGAKPTNNEWDQFIGNTLKLAGLPTPGTTDLSGSYRTNSPHNQKWNWVLMRSWGQEKYRNDDTIRVLRGYQSSRHITGASVPGTKLGHHGWRPILEVLNTGPTFTQIPTQTTKKGNILTVNLANYFSDVDGDKLTYSAASSNTNIATASVSGNTLTLSGKEIGSVTITVTASDGTLTASQSFKLNVANTVPTVSVSSPSANMTLYENDTFNVAGSASDVDKNQSVTVYAQINNEQRIALNVGLSNAAIPFNKQLKFIGGKLYDVDTPITGNLTDGVPHTLKIWAQDGDGGQSAITERTFYAVPNRPPVLTVDTVQPNGIINTDKFTISGDASDPDGNPVTAAYRVNGGNSVALEITDGKWAFEIALAQLQVGLNTIVVELVDSYNFKVSKTIKLNKEEVKTPILDSVARYKIEPPKLSAKGVLLWIQRDEDLTDLEVELSMTLQGEQESYVTLTATNTAPVDSNTVEDEFYFEANEAKNNIILKLSTSRQDININHKIHLISGVLE